MKSSSFALIASVICAAVALAACGAPAIAPSQAGLGNQAGPAVRYAASHPCNIRDAWYFHGACAVDNVTSAGGTFALAQYRKITLTKTIGKNTAAGSQAFVFADATGQGDITGKRAGAAFRLYGAKSCVTGFTCPGTALIYSSDFNKGNEIALLGTTKVTVTDAAGLRGKKRCFPAALTPVGWIADPKIGARPTRTTFTITFPRDKFFLRSGQTVLAYACM